MKRMKHHEWHKVFLLNCYKSLMRNRQKIRKKTLAIDNCPAHPKIVHFQSIELFFHAPNVTLKLVSMYPKRGNVFDFNQIN